MQNWLKSEIEDSFENMSVNEFYDFIQWAINKYKQKQEGDGNESS